MDPLEALQETVRDIVGRIKPAAREAVTATAQYAASRARHIRASAGSGDMAEIVRLEAHNVRAHAIEHVVELADTADDSAWAALEGALGVAARLI
jgi:hypothetical protein